MKKTLIQASIVLFPLLFYIGFRVVGALRFRYSEEATEPYALFNQFSDPSSCISLHWETAEECRGYVRYGPVNSSKVEEIEELQPAHLHSFYLRNLKSTTEYKYSTSCNKEKANFDHRFVTGAKDAKEMTLLVVSDTQVFNGGISHLPLVFDSMTRSYPFHTPIFITGDVTDDPDWKVQYNYFFQTVLPYLKNKTLITLPGNHDGNYNKARTFYYPYYFGWSTNSSSKFKGLNHTYITDKMLIVMLADEEEIPKEWWQSQFEWLESVFQTYSDKPIKIVMSHRPHFYPGPRGGNVPHLQELMKLYERFRVNFIINGHDHVYRRMDIYKNNIPVLTHFCIGGSGGIFDEINYWDDQETDGYSAIIQKVNPCPHYLVLTVKGDEVYAEAKTLSGDILDKVAAKVFANGSISYLSGDYPSRSSRTLLITPFRLMENYSYFPLILCVLFVVGAIVVSCISGKADVSHFSGLRDYLHEKVNEITNYKCSEPLVEPLIEPDGGIKSRVTFYLIHLSRAFISICATHLSAALPMALYSFCCLVFYGFYGYENLSLHLSTLLILILSSIYLLLFIYFVDPFLIRIFCNVVVFVIYLFGLNQYNNQIEAHFYQGIFGGIRLFSLIFSLILEIVIPICLTELAHFVKSLRRFRLYWFKALYTYHPFELWNWSPKLFLHWGFFAGINALIIADLSFGWYGLSLFGAFSFWARS